MKYLLTLLFLASLQFANAQKSLEAQIADTACLCLSSLDSSQISTRGNGLKMACLQEAMIKNQASIQEQYEKELRKEEDEEKHGIRGSLMIKVQNILSEKCPAYGLFEKELQERHKP